MTTLLSAKEAHQKAKHHNNHAYDSAHSAVLTDITKGIGIRAGQGEFSFKKDFYSYFDTDSLRVKVMGDIVNLMTEFGYKTKVDVFIGGHNGGACFNLEVRWDEVNG